MEHPMFNLTIKKKGKTKRGKKAIPKLSGRLKSREIKAGK